MGRLATIVLFGLLSFPAIAATGDGVTIELPNCPVPKGVDLPDGYLTGANIAGATEATIHSYLIGFINGMSISAVMGARKGCIELIYACLGRYDLGDLSRRLVLYIRERPDRLRENANVVTYNAIFGRCISEIL